ncbi:hypothetical protein KDA_45440 [Dictyobacter alpinus]|uniref:SnoaL-like domain-containing protein n=1 Tax=Dictyobacter alpinus TaxID=2014873 RepID=A0A402BCM7_9CHLR|nr:nuclear transport factor 2 family protein [Dictyobacter alpinus]GCE29060.1 hypothetical protein KDA_45440 [Dictyobacter alpinus]
MQQEKQATWKEHPNAQVVRDFFAAFGVADAARMGELVHEDLVWHFPGSSPIAGDWQGVDGILNGIRAVAMTLRDGKGGFELLEVTANEHCALSVHRDFYTGPDNQLDLRYVLYIQMKDGKMAEVWEIPFDLPENDRFNNKQAGALAKRLATSVSTK